MLPLTPQTVSSGQNKSWGLPDIQMDGRRVAQELVQDLVQHLWRSLTDWIWKDGVKCAILPCRRIPAKNVMKKKMSSKITLRKVEVIKTGLS